MAQQPEPAWEPALRTALGIVVATVMVLVGMSWINPHASIPVVSQTVCAARGMVADAAWYDGPYGPAGCYDTSPDAASIP